jgi:hypothetical protein
VNLNYLIGPGCALLGALFSLYVKDRATDAAEDEFGKNIKAALSVFKMELIECFDGKFVRKGECELMMEAQNDRIDIGDVRLSNIENRINLQSHPRNKS